MCVAVKTRRQCLLGPASGDGVEFDHIPRAVNHWSKNTYFIHAVHRLLGQQLPGVHFPGGIKDGTAEFVHAIMHTHVVGRAESLPSFLIHVIAL